MLFREGLINLREGRGLNQKELAEKTGVNRASINHIERETRPPSSDAQWLLAAYFNMTPEQVMLHGKRIKENLPPPDPGPRPFQIFVNGTDDKGIIESTEENYRGIPLFESGRLAAGSNGLYFNDSEVPESEVIVYRPELGHRAGHKLAAVRVGGNSMSPTIPWKAIVVIDRDDREFANSKIFCVNDPDDTGQYVSAVKRVQRWEKGFVLISDNPETPPKVTALDWAGLCVGRVIWMWRNTEEL